MQLWVLRTPGFLDIPVGTQPWVPFAYWVPITKKTARKTRFYCLFRSLSSSHNKTSSVLCTRFKDFCRTERNIENPSIYSQVHGAKTNSRKFRWSATNHIPCCLQPLLPIGPSDCLVANSKILRCFPLDNWVPSIFACCFTERFFFGFKLDARVGGLSFIKKLPG